MVDPPITGAYWHRLTVRYLLVQSVAAVLWWALMFAKPEWRPLFFPDGGTDLLWSFLAADVPLFIGLGLVASSGLEKRQSYGWPALLVHTGAALYASVYTIALAFITNKAWLGATLMLPPLLVLPYLAWRLRP